MKSRQQDKQKRKKKTKYGEKNKYNMLEMGGVRGLRLLSFLLIQPISVIFSLFRSAVFISGCFNNLGKTLAEGNLHIVSNIRRAY